MLLFWPTPNSSPARCPDQNKNPIHLGTARGEYLLGEPVLLQLTLTNLGLEGFKVPEAFLQISESEIPIYVDGRRFLLGYPSWRPSSHASLLLQSGQNWKYWLRVGYGYFEHEHEQGAPPTRLVFDKPGTYTLRTGSGPRDPQPYNQHSNEVSVRIRTPAGVDAKVWQRLQKMEGIFGALQWYEGPWREHVPKLIDLLEEVPETGYAETFRSALRRFYFSQRLKVSLEERAKIRQLTGITDLREFKDPRLDVLIEPPFDPAKARIRIDGSIQLRIDTLLEVLAEQSKVPLEATTYLRRRTVGFTKPPPDLRGYMEHDFVTDRLHAWWVKRGDGYVLVCDEEETFKNLAGQKRDSSPK